MSNKSSSDLNSKTQFYTKKWMLYIIHLFKSPILYIVPIGLIIYLVYLHKEFGDWLYFWHSQPVFGAERNGNTIILPIQVLWRYAKILLSLPLSERKYWIALLELTSFVGVIYLLLLAYFRRVRFSYILFSLLLILIPSLTGTFSSIPRYVLVCFPLYIVIGSIRNKYFYLTMMFLMFVLQTILLLTFVSGRWVA